MTVIVQVAPAASGAVATGQSDDLVAKGDVNPEMSAMVSALDEALVTTIDFCVVAPTVELPKSYKLGVNVKADVSPEVGVVVVVGTIPVMDETAATFAFFSQLTAITRDNVNPSGPTKLASGDIFELKKVFIISLPPVIPVMAFGGFFPIL